MWTKSSWCFFDTKHIVSKIHCGWSGSLWTGSSWKGLTMAGRIWPWLEGSDRGWKGREGTGWEWSTRGGNGVGVDWHLHFADPIHYKFAYHERLTDDLFERAPSDLLRDFIHINTQLEEEQKCGRGLRSQTEKMDVFGILPTGFGERLVHNGVDSLAQLLPFVHLNICSFLLIFGFSMVLCFTRVYEGHFMLCY